AIEQTSIQLELPLACVPGDNCWVVNYVDHDPGSGRRDYYCRHMTYDAHNGTDLAIADRARMDAGVAVRAAAKGVVTGTRNDMADISIRDGGNDAVKGRECGNGVTVDHGNGWSTQYCHLRRGSILVRRGEQVAVGQSLGFVGLSGMTEFPHVHFSVRHGDRVIDPFTGTAMGEHASCGPGARPLWSAAAAAALIYRPVSVTAAGLVGRVPDRAEVQQGVKHPSQIMRDADVIGLYAEVLGPGAGDQIALRIYGPDGKLFAQNLHRVETERITQYRFVGRKRGADPWPSGTYRGEVEVTLAGGGDAARWSDILDVR
ncbi:MAG: M23 family metallopeptidase, partial [Alphaproteobacteria bacterium]|nr:M23 family metallopeptidase [Alphaproteobacteria bacterium]